MNLLIDFTDYIFKRVIETADEITPDILDWKPVKESNSTRWILTHLTRIAYILIPQVITGTHNPNGWDDDYEAQDHSLDELRSDLKKARENVLSLLGGLDKENLNKDIIIWGSTRPLKEPIFVLLGELMHHKGQIDMLRGIRKRTEQLKQ